LHILTTVQSFVNYCSLTQMQTYTRQTWDYKPADLIALNDALTPAAWDTAYTIFDDTDDLQMCWETPFLDLCKSYMYLFAYVEETNSGIVSTGVHMLTI
jgi:hypothetical protein